MTRGQAGLSRRERQVMDILYQRRKATAAEVMESMPDAPGYSAVRTLLASLEAKGYIKHDRDGAKYVFVPVLPPEKAGRSAISHLIHTFFNGSRARAAVALLDASSRFSEKDLDELELLIQRARKRGKSRPTGSAS